MKSAQLLSDLGLTMGLPGLAFNADGCARLVFDDTHAVNFESSAETGQLLLYIALGPLPAAGREALYLSLLEGNLFGAQTDGATLAVDSLNHEVVLCRKLVTDELSAQSFTEIVESFVNCAEQWRARLESAVGPAEADPAHVPFDSANQFGGFIRG
jgi:hypothetical protein